MTPAVRAAQAAGIPFAVRRYPAASGEGGWGREAVERLGLDAAQVFKTLIARLDAGKLVVAVIPVEERLDLKALASAAGGKSAAMASASEAQRATGYVLGGISPLGQRTRLPVFVDESMVRFDRVYVSAGRRGVELELSPDDLIRLCAGTVSALTR